MELLPHAGLMPVTKSAPARHSGATTHFAGQHLPVDAALEDEQNAPKSGTVTHRWSPPTSRSGAMFRQQRFHYRPQFVTHQSVSHTLGVPRTAFLLEALNVCWQ